MSPPPPPPGSLGGYLLSESLGCGGCAQVWRARQPRLEREVALKLLDPARAANAGTRERFLEEARLGGRINHTNVVTYYELREQDGWLLMALELVAEGDLCALQRRHNGRLPERLALGLCRDLAAGLECVARCGVVHRDIKPANVLLTREMLPKIADFGAAMPAAAALQARHRDRRERVVIGTPGYMAPEQARAGAHVDARADLFALGATLHHLLTGRTPWVSEQPQQILAQMRRGEPPLIEEAGRRFSAATAAILRCCLASDPAERYPTPRALMVAIDEALHAAARHETEQLADLEGRVSDRGATAADPAHRRLDLVWAVF